MADPDWHGGRYVDQGTHPHRGLAVARMAGHITYLSGRAASQVRPADAGPRPPTFSFDADFQVESYLRYQGSSFVERFDANSYLYLTRAMDYFDIAGDHNGVLAKAFSGIQTRFCVVSFTSDWLFPTSNHVRWCMRSTPPVRGCRSRRSRPIAATTRSCSTCPNSSTSPALSCNRRASARLGNNPENTGGEP